MPLIFDEGPSGILTYQDHIYLKTEWMDGSLKPAHVGVYERDYSHSTNGDEILGLQFNYWDGRVWWLFGKNPREAKEQYDYAFAEGGLGSWHQDTLPWRGLTKPVMEKLA